MKTIVAVLAAFAATVLSTGALAQDAEALAKNNGCTACHTMDKKLIGPGLKEIAAKYRGNKAAEADLVKKVKGGSKGVWGDIQMPANAHVKDEDIKTIVQWILSLK